MANTSSVVTGQTSKRLDSSSSSSISTTGPLAVASLLAYVRGDDLHSICLLPGYPLRAASLRAASLILLSFSSSFFFRQHERPAIADLLLLYIFEMTWFDANLTTKESGIKNAKSKCTSFENV